MNQGGTPQASRPPIIEPALVPTMYSASAGSQPVSRAIASSPPVSQAPPMTPPAPSTSPTLMLSPPHQEVYDRVSLPARGGRPGLAPGGGAKAGRPAAAAGRTLLGGLIVRK